MFNESMGTNYLEGEEANRYSTFIGGHPVFSPF